MGRIEEVLEEAKSKNLLRALRPASGRAEGKIILGGREYVDFSSNDYLGLSNHPRLTRAACEAAERFGTSSSASRLLSGDLSLHHQLEEAVAGFKNKESSLVFNSGYQANTGIISALYGRQDAVFSDRLCHASIIDGIILSGANSFRFRHNDPEHLERLLKDMRIKFREALIVTESIFSMDGDKAPLREIVRLAKEHDCRVMVDEAHATGIFGTNGSGIVEEEGLSEETDLIMGTFGKALGGFGAYLACPQKIKEFLINTCRAFIYSTALPPPVIACGLESLAVVRDEPERRKTLLENAGYFRDTLKRSGFNIKGSSQIIPLVVGDSRTTVAVSEALVKEGYWALPIRPPTVPADQARLRFSLTYYHTKEILNGLVHALREKYNI